MSENLEIALVISKIPFYQSSAVLIYDYHCVLYKPVDQDRGRDDQWLRI